MVWGACDRDEARFPSARLLAQSEILLALCAADGDAGLSGFVARVAVAGDAAGVVFFCEAGALEEGAPDLHLREVGVFPEGPAQVLDVERADAGEEEDGALELGGVRGHVDLKQVQGAAC